jgi:PBSX family phage portal protein
VEKENLPSRVVDDGFQKLVGEYEEVIKVSFFGGREEEREKTEGKSQQIFSDPFEEMASGEYLIPPTNPTTWAAAMEQNTRLNKCVKTFARNTVGLGWEIVPIISVNEQTPKGIREQIQTETIRLTRLFTKPNRKMPFTKVMELMKVDEEATGNGFLEIVRNNAGQIEQIWHIPATTVRVRNPKRVPWMEPDGHPGYIQIRGQIKRYFKEFGDATVINAKTGEKASGALPIQERATEIIHFLVYAPRSTWYGIPRYIAASPAIAGNRLAALRNVRFFENDAVPRLIITVTGGGLTQASVKSIENFIRRGGKGVENAHRIMVLQTERRRIGTADSKAGINVVPLTVGTQDDASFMQYRVANDEEVREAFGIGKAFFTTDDVNRASMGESRRITNEQEFEPDRVEKEYVMNETVVADESVGAETVALRFKRPRSADPLEKAQVEQIYASLGALTPNELRKSIGLEPYPDMYVFANKPYSLALIELQIGLALAIENKGMKFPEPAQKIMQGMLGDLEKLMENVKRMYDGKEDRILEVAGEKF